MLEENYLSNDPVNYPIGSNGLSYVKQQETTNKTKGQIISEQNCGVLKSAASFQCMFTARP